MAAVSRSPILGKMGSRPGRDEVGRSMVTRADLWAKLARDASGCVTAWHSLVHHSADVAAVLLVLLEQPTIAARLARLAEREGLDAVTCARLGALAFLHDIGKANRGFRARVDGRACKIVGGSCPCLGRLSICRANGDRIWSWYSGSSWRRPSAGCHDGNRPPRFCMLSAGAGAGHGGARQHAHDEALRSPRRGDVTRRGGAHQTLIGPFGGL